MERLRVRSHSASATSALVVIDNTWYSIYFLRSITKLIGGTIDWLCHSQRVYHYLKKWEHVDEGFNFIQAINVFQNFPVSFSNATWIFPVIPFPLISQCEVFIQGRPTHSFQKTVSDFPFSIGNSPTAYPSLTHHYRAQKAF